MSKTPMQIILAEDNDGDIFLVKRALKQSAVPFEMRVAHNGEDALLLMDDLSAQHPDVIVLDLNLPRLSGAHVLSQIRANPKFNHTPVIILTSSDSARDRIHALELGADRYFCKPSELNRFMDLGRLIEETATQGRSQPPVN